MPSFAKAQLLKYGWTEGKGLGKNEDGAVDPVRQKLKFDKSGLGHDSKEDKWWESAYNEASKNVRIRESRGSGEITVKSAGKKFECPKSKLRKKKCAKSCNLRYGSFLKYCTLKNGTVLDERDKPTIDDIVNETASIALTDEELFRACGGRTAHKGARHGLKMNGKLARIAQQEAQLWANAEKGRSNFPKNDLVESTSIVNNELADSNANTLESVEQLAVGTFSSSGTRERSKGSKRREQRRFRALANQLDAFSLIDDVAPETGEPKKRKRKKKEPEPTSLGNSKKRAKKKKDLETTRDNDGKAGELTREKTVELFDGSIITLDDENDNDDNEVQEIPRKPKKDMSEAERSNYRIDKKKRKAQAKSEKKLVERLSDCLMAVNLCEDSVDSGRGEDLVEGFEVSRKLKKWKKHRREKRDKRIEEVINLEP